MKPKVSSLLINRTQHYLLPLGERIDTRRAASFDQFRKSHTPLEQAFQKLRQGVFLTGDPVGRDAFPSPVDHFLGKVHNLVQPWL